MVRVLVTQEHVTVVQTCWQREEAQSGVSCGEASRAPSLSPGQCPQGEALGESREGFPKRIQLSRLHQGPTVPATQQAKCPQPDREQLG